MTKTLKVLVTGENRDLEQSLPLSLKENSALSIEWIEWPVLEFEKLQVPETLLSQVVERPFEWLVFTSPRAVHFWTATLVEAGIDLPLETQVACIGEKTAEVAADDGYTPDFYPTEPGSEIFLEEFEALIATNAQKPTVLIPMAEGGRLKIAERLRELGCSVTVVALYRTRTRSHLGESIPANGLKDLSAIVFTSPSSVEAVLSCSSLPEQVKIFSIGHFTQECLEKKGFQSLLLPGSSFERITEVLP